MSENIKQFLEADALRTQGELLALENGEQVGIREEYLPGKKEWGTTDKLYAQTHTFNPNDASFIAAASRIAPDIRNLMAAFEQVCEALEYYKENYEGGGCVPCDNLMAKEALTAAAPWRKLMGGV